VGEIRPLGAAKRRLNSVGCETEPENGRYRLAAQGSPYIFILIEKRLPAGEFVSNNRKSAAKGEIMTNSEARRGRFLAIPPAGAWGLVVRPSDIWKMTKKELRMTAEGGCPICEVRVPPGRSARTASSVAASGSRPSIVLASPTPGTFYGKRSGQCVRPQPSDRP